MVVLGAPKGAQSQLTFFTGAAVVLFLVPPALHAASSLQIVKAMGV